MGVKINLILILFAFIVTPLATSQQYSIDISGLDNEEYTPGENLTFKIILLKDETQTDAQVNYKITDILNKKEITGTTTSNQETSTIIENNFPSGIWTITATYQDAQVERTFIVGENSEIKFLIEGDELIIRNTGNIRYTKTIQIKIGSEINTYAQNIKAGSEKILKLISIDGEYDIEVTDGETTIKRQNVQLFGTGNVVGAVDKNLVGYTGFAGADSTENLDNINISLTKVPISLIFIAAIGILTAIVIVQQKITKKKTKNK